MNRVEFGQVIGREAVRRIRQLAPGLIGECSPEYRDRFDDFRAAMMSSGCTLLGAGNFSMVWHHPKLDDKVVKVCAAAEQDCGAIYLAWARRNAGRKHIPTVYHLEICHGGLLYFAVLDKLERMDYDSPARELYDEWSSQSYKRLQYQDYSTPQVKAFAETVQEIYDFHSGWCGTDLHDANVMVDSRGELVITDPLSYYHGTAEQRSSVLSTYSGVH